MTAIIRWGGGLLATLLVCSASFANPWWCQPVPNTWAPQAPDACGPGYYSCGPYGMVYGPNYDLYPPFPPFQGIVPNRCGPGGMGGPGGGLPYPGQQQIRNNYPTHPYARGPRDFFMWGETIEDLRGRDLRPNLVP